MRRRRTPAKPESTLALGDQSISALLSPTTSTEIRVVIIDERAHRERVRIEQQGSADDAAPALTNHGVQGAPSHR